MPSHKFTISAPSTLAVSCILAVSGVVAVVPLEAVSASPPAHPALTGAMVAVPKPSLVPGGKVIVVLKDQHASAPVVNGTTHVQSAAVAQAARVQVAAAVRSVGGTVRANLSIVSAVAATMTSREATAIAHRSDVAEVIPDAIITAPTHTPDARTPTPQPPTAPVAGACPTNPSAAQLGPEALEDTHADSDVTGAKTARSLGYTGAGVTVAFMAEGIDIDNPDFMRNGRSIFSDYQDFSGDGRAAPTSGGEAFLDATSIAAQGNVVYNLRNFSDRPLSRDCKIRIEGEAPGVNLVGLKVFGDQGAPTSGILQGIQYAVDNDHVDILNQSFGSDVIPDTSQDVIKAADEAATVAGTTVTVSSGDEGIANTIGSPASDPAVITVGASTTYQTYLQNGAAGARLPGITGWKSNNISGLSSAGFDADGRTVTLVAPGDSTFVVCTANLRLYSDCTNQAGVASNVVSFGGTSESAPVVAGVAALVIQAYRAGHNNRSPTPAEIRRILTATADDIGAPAEQQGAGLVDAYKAVQLAKAYGPRGTPTGTALENSLVRYSAVAAPRTPETVKATLTNRGTSTQTIRTAGREIGAYRNVSTTKVSLSDRSSPKYVTSRGVKSNYEAVSFTVPAGQARLATSIAYRGDGATMPDNIVLVDPQGDLTGYSFSTGVSNFSHAEVANPVAGRWTAYILGAESTVGGADGPVRFSADVARYKTFGKVTPAKLTLAPGKSGVVTMHVGTKATPGDLAGSLVFTSNALATTGRGATVTTVPITLRSQIPAGPQKFVQTLTGGSSDTGAQFYYEIAVKKGTPELNAAVRLNLNRNNPFQAVLVSPGGNATAFASNQLLTTSPVIGPVSTLVKGLQLHTLAPQAGRWQLVIAFAPTVSGGAVSTPFTVSTDDRARSASVVGLPDSKTTVLKAGRTTNYFLRIKNTGPAPESYFVDGRLAGRATYSLTSVTDPRAIAPVSDAVPVYVVPSDTVKIGAAAATNGSRSLQFDMAGPLGSPDIASNAGSEPEAFYGADPVSPGAWSVFPSQVGPYAAAATPENVVTAMLARTRAFDPALTSSTGDLWYVSLDPSTTINAVTVNPGDTAVIQVKITPKKGKHSVVGTLFVDDANLLVTSGSTLPSPNANQVVAIPYRYSVK